MKRTTLTTLAPPTGPQQRLPGLLAAVCLIAAVIVAGVSIWLCIVLVREYGPAEGYGTLALQVLPIGGIGAAVALALALFAARLLRRRRR